MVDGRKLDTSGIDGFRDRAGRTPRIGGARRQVRLGGGPDDIKRLVALRVYGLVKAKADPLTTIVQRTTIDAVITFGPSVEEREIIDRYARFAVMSAMSAVVIWRPEPLNAEADRGSRPRRRSSPRLARAKAPCKRVAASIFVTGTATNFQVGSASPLGAFFEQGTGPHEIAPKKKALKLADGSFVSGSVQHPGMKAQPFLRPLLPLWGSLYRRQAAGAFRGF